MIALPAASAASRAPHRLLERWFAGLTWQWAGLVTLVCLIDALRRWAWALFLATPRELFVGVVQSFAFASIVLWLTMLAGIVAYNRASSAPLWRYVAIAVAVAASSAYGALFMLIVEPVNTPNGWNDQGSLSWRFELYWPRYAVLGTLLVAAFVYLRLAQKSDDEAHAVELERALLDRQLDAERLNVLQAQIEPHFLFNTLATVSRLYETDPPAASSMLDNLLRYLGVALPQMRAVDSTLGREAALAAAYLAIQQIRMGPRLRFSVDVPAALATARMPPMMLLTLVENAIKHGLNPLAEGGSVRIDARASHGVLRLAVADTGRGFTRSLGTGAGLANIRARLAATYGDDAELAIDTNAPHGAIVTIALPHATVETAAATT